MGDPLVTPREALSVMVKGENKSCGLQRDRREAAGTVEGRGRGLGRG